MVLKHNKLHSRVAHRGIARFLGIDECVLSPLIFLPEIFMKICMIPPLCSGRRLRPCFYGVDVAGEKRRLPSFLFRVRR